MGEHLTTVYELHTHVQISRVLDVEKHVPASLTCRHKQTITTKGN